MQMFLSRSKALFSPAILVLFGASMMPAGTLFTYNGFSSTAGLTLTGNAATTTTSDGTVLRVTPATDWQAGAAYSTTPVVLGSGNTFSTQFSFRFTNPGGIAPADGITFVLAASPTGLGGAGVGIGYQGVPNSVAIEFDTYNNGGADNSSNHVSIDTDGNLNDMALSNLYGIQNCDFGTTTSYTTQGCMSDGNLWTATITYNGSNLNVSVNDPGKGTTFNAISNYAIDIGSMLGTNSAYVGFTSGTGAGNENHDITTWTFANTATLPPPPTTGSAPEPAVSLLAGSGLAVLALIRRKRR